MSSLKRSKCRRERPNKLWDYPSSSCAEMYSIRKSSKRCTYIPFINSCGCCAYMRLGSEHRHSCKCAPLLPGVFAKLRFYMISHTTLTYFGRRRQSTHKFLHCYGELSTYLNAALAKSKMLVRCVFCQIINFRLYNRRNYYSVKFIILRSSIGRSIGVSSFPENAPIFNKRAVVHCESEDDVLVS